MKSARYYRFLEFCRDSWLYALLIGGALIFSWPFLWMATTSVKVDRELFGEKLRLFPTRPIPHPQSPYVDTRHFQDVEGPRMDALLPVIEAALAKLDYPWPADLDRPTLQREAARGVFKKLQDTIPVAQWQSANLPAAIPTLIQAGMVADAVRQVRRQLLIGQLRARSYDLQEDQLVAPDRVATTWQVTGPATIEQAGMPQEPHGAVKYDLTKAGKFELRQTFTTSFPVARLYRLQLYLRPDDTWHPVTLYVEKLGKKFKAERTRELADYSNWGVLTWQEPGPDDLTNKIKTWTLLREVETSDVTGANEIRVTLEVARNDATGAWWAKMRRNYQFALDHIPFWRYVATSIFLVVLNLVGTLFSCSLVAYAFARLQWPGRNFCFALMLATMMVPGQVTMIPYFLIVKALGWYNTLYPLWVGSLFAGAFNVFLLRQFLKGIPRDLEDAAKIDGCGFWRVYWHIMLPLIKPTLAAIAIFTFMGVWNEFMGPLIYLQDQRQYPLALGLYAFNVQAGGSMSMMMAGSLMMTAPVILIFFFAQKYFIQGITLTGMKG
jgi:ABC-type glycerol-3-phosphate transport system permease component